MLTEMSRLLLPKRYNRVNRCEHEKMDKLDLLTNWGDGMYRRARTDKVVVKNSSAPMCLYSSAFNSAGA